MSRSAQVLIGIAVAVASVCWWLLNAKTAHHHPPGSRSLHRMNNLRISSLAFHDTFNRWPTNMAELIENAEGIRFMDGLVGGSEFKDEWGRPLLFTAPNDAQSYGSIRSLGADGRPGGWHRNQDLMVKFGNDREANANKPPAPYP